MICPYCDRVIEIKTICDLTLEEIEKLKRFKVENRFSDEKVSVGGSMFKPEVKGCGEVMENWVIGSKKKLPNDVCGKKGFLCSECKKKFEGEE